MNRQKGRKGRGLRGCAEGAAESEAFKTNGFPAP